MGDNDIRSSNSIISSVLDDDEILIPGNPPSPNSRVLKKINADLMRVLLQVDIEQYHFIMLVYITQIQKLLKDQIEFRKRLNELDEIKEKIKLMQQFQKNSDGARLNAAQIEYLIRLKEKIDQAIVFLNQKIQYLEIKIETLKDAINNLDREIESSAKRYQGLIENTLLIDDLKLIFRDVKLAFGEGQELIVTPQDAYKIRENIVAKLKENPDLDLYEEAVNGFDAMLKEKHRKIYPAMSVVEHERVVNYITSSDKNKLVIRDAIARIIQPLQANAIIEQKNILKQKIVERAANASELAKAEMEKASCKREKEVLESACSVVSKAIENKKCDPVLLRETTLGIFSSTQNIMQDLGEEPKIVEEATSQFKPRSSF